MTFCVQGLGYVGAATCAAISLATDKNNNALYNVIGVDLNTNEGLSRIKSLNKGKFSFQTNDSLRSSVEDKKLRYSPNPIGLYE